MTAAYRSRNTRAEGLRRALTAKVHIAKQQLGMSDPEYRALLASYGVESSTQLSTRSLDLLLGRFRDLGWQEKPRAKAAKDRHGLPRPLRKNAAHSASTLDREALLQKVQALLSEKGSAEGSYVSWDYALAILKRQCGVERLDWATPEQLVGLIAALDKDAKRKGRRRK